MKHTPTPWQLVKPESQYGNQAVKVNIRGNMLLIASISWIEGEDGKANAAFIVQACNAHDELLEAVKMVIEAAIGASDEQTCRNIHWPTLRKAIDTAERK